MAAKRWGLAAFFIFMGVCTVISRVYDSVTIPKVQTTAAKRKAVETVVEGMGTVTVKEKTGYLAQAGLRIGQVFVEPGSEVEEGEPLFSYDGGSMADKRDEILREMEQLDLDMEQERISQESYGGMSQEEGAQWELAMAQRELSEGQAEYEEALAEHERQLQRLKDDYEDSLSLTEEELWLQQIRDWESARQDLDSAKAARDRELRAAQRDVEDLKEQIDLAQDEETVRSLERDLKRAREDMEDLRRSWETQITSASFQLDFVEGQEERIQAGQTTAQEAKKESYEAAVKQQEDSIKAAGEKLADLQKAVERTQWQVAAARKEDSAAAMSREQKKRLSDLAVKGMENTRKVRAEELAHLEELIAEGGQVQARESGVIVDVEVAAGKTATGEELVTAAVGGSRFQGTFEKEEQKLSKGDTISIAIPGTQRTKEAVIDAMNLLGDKDGTFQADLGDLEMDLGTVTSYTCRKQSDLFAKVIPLEGLRKDMKGYYCLVARSRSSILGEEFRAERVDVEVLYRGSREAAIEGMVLEEDRIIIREDQTIGEGDRVRVMTGNGGDNGTEKR
ncbi:MAG: hypothetical protein HFG71_06270 [Hungatella sp.]|nr:hypothetical protein [Hungatella sp.]